MKFETHIKTIEDIVKENFEFIIPVYQRPYVWDDEEIKKLLDDILNIFINISFDSSNYFVGNTYVIKSSNKIRKKQYELIDGQQRFTTFWLIANAFKLLNIKTDITDYLEIAHSNNTKDIRFDFDIRIEVANYLKGLLDNSSYIKFSDVSQKEFLKFIAKGVETIKHFITSEIKEEQRADFGNYIYKNVYFIFNVAPKNTDLNSLFTALGTSGIQLQQSDILKARLLEKVNKNSRIKYSKIWEACEDMSNYFEKNVSDVFNIERANIKSENFKSYEESFFKSENTNASENSHKAKTISEIINNEEVDIKVDITNTDNSSKCRSIISFNILLIHSYRIFNLQKQRKNFEHAIDPKTILSTIKLETFSTSEEAEYFFELLWKIRHVFDKHIVKWRFEEDDDNDEKLLLTEITTSRSYNKNYFSRTNLSYSSSQMLQSVLYFTGGFTQQYWLTPFLYFLLENENLSNTQIIAELEKIDNLMLPGDKKEISIELASQVKRNEKIDLKSLSILDISHGTSFHHYWFYKLEYLLWKDWIDREKSEFKNYRITSKNSIEHVFPQNHEFGNKLENTEFDWLNSFGNLGLLSVGENSSYNNQDVRKKKVDFDNKRTYDSLKLAKVYSSQDINSWDIENIKQHQDKMIRIIQQHYKK
ncbi:DUF262 domain-containing protein [Chryseobacterium luquanense]|uniref:DUF262 domain-containing HNH endonuclease family protein n=1 Tax=Chryseobacterium luquanense TaxID=2983766 RepID=A0ABT3Y3S3_9FLAO|nr:DUF262 domain-containing HNH endonuclease family protein [Chryseobacterium luquanense]MCX8532671.1 DUF262 domain-containing HNH endonuclease family protein [Chryseobacterium luquanense]